MVIRLAMSNGLPSLVGIGGAGSRGLNSARRFLEEELSPEYRSSGCSLMTLNQTEAIHPAVAIVIVFENDVDSREGLAAWVRRLQSSSPGLVLFYIVGDLGSISLPGPYVLIEANASADVQLTAALNCVAKMLVGHNLVNLRASELRKVCGEAPQLFFSTGLGSGEERAHTALNQALDAPGMRERIRSARGVWAQVTAPRAPMLWEVDTVIESLRSSAPDDAIVWTGGTDSRADGNVAGVSMLVSMS